MTQVNPVEFQSRKKYGGLSSSPPFWTRFEYVTSPLERSVRSDIRITRVTGAVKGPDAIAIDRIARQSSVGKTGGIGADLRNLNKAGAVIVLAPLNAEAVLVV